LPARRAAGGGFFKEELMARALLASVLAVGLLLIPVVALGQIQMPYSVVGCGGGQMSGANHTVHGTVGQSVIGVVSGPNHTNEIGFWYRPGWILTGIDDESDLYPTAYWLGQNHPNPFNPVTTLQFGLPEATEVTVKLYDAAGREVRTLVDRRLDAGYHRITVEGGSLSSGVYFCRMVADEFVETRKLVLLK
jgi:hypothetical protein